MAGARRHSTVAVALATGVAAACATAPATARPPLAVGDGKPVHGKVKRWLRQSQMPFVLAVQIVRAPCPAAPHFSGCVYRTDSSRIYLHPRVRDGRLVLYHELGHVYDLRILNAGDRETFRRIMGLGGGAWFQGSTPPAELFADAYGMCARYGARWPAGRKNAAYHYSPTRAQHRAVCRVIRRAASPHGRGPSPPPRSPQVIGPSPSPPPVPPTPQ